MKINDGGAMATTHPSSARRKHRPLLNKRTWLMLTTGLLFISGVVQAQYAYTTNNGAITITGYTGPGNVVAIPSVINGLPVTEIGNYAFGGNNSLTNVTIPGSVLSIGYSAFANCYGLSNVTMSAGVTNLSQYAFDDCESLVSASIPNTVVNIGYGAFGYTALTKVTIPASTTFIDTYAFGDCYSLTNITVDLSNPAYSSLAGVLFDKNRTTLLQYPGGNGGNYTVPGSVITIGNYAFYDCYNLSNVTISAGVSNISDSAFDYCENMASVTIPNTVVSIGSSAFYNTGLTNVTIPASTTFIDSYAFVDCYNLTNITVDPSNPAYSSLGGVLFDKNQISLLTYPTGKVGSYTVPNSVTNIGDYAFEDCYYLSNVTISAHVVTIGNSVFESCRILTNVFIPASVTSIGNYTFIYLPNVTAFTVDSNNLAYSSLAGVFFDKNRHTLFQYPIGKTGGYTIPTGVTTIAYEAFDNCTNLTSLTVPASVTSIGQYAFEYCYNLTNVNLLANATSITYGAFYECYRLAKVTIPASVTSIGNYVFYYCTNLTGVYFTGNNAPASIGDSTYYNDNNLTNYYLLGATGFGSSYGGRPTAIWAGAPYAILTALANPTNGGTVSGSGTYPIGTNVQITATPTNGWYFTGWSNSHTDNPYTVTVASGVETDIANFATCDYVLPTASTNVDMGAGSGSVAITAENGCAWTATNNVTWLTITGGASGSGNGTVSYSVAANTSNCTSRVGILTIGNQTFTVTQAAGLGSFGVSATSTNVGAGAGNSQLAVTAGVGCTWTATNNVSWLTITGGASGSGNGTISYSIAANTANCTNRVGTITIGGPSIGNQTLTVTQANGNGSFALATTSTNVAASVGSGSVSVMAGVGCTWTANNNVSWLTITGGASGSGNGTVSYSIAANTANCTNRTGILTIGTQQFIVRQDAGTGSYTLTGASTNVAAIAGSGSVNLTAGNGCAWTAISNTNWLQTSSGGLGSGTISYTFDANQALISRNGTITVGGQTFTVTQAGAATATISVQANPSEGGNASGGGTYLVGTSIQITAVATNGWTFTGWSDGSANNPDAITVPTTNITYTANFATCTYAFGATSTNVGANAGSGSVGLTTLAGCAWTATSNTNWIHTTSSGAGNGMVGYSFDANPAGSSRSGTITVQGQTLTITQAGATATISVQANPAGGGHGGGAGTYAIGTNVQLIATANIGWQFTGWNDSNTNAARLITVALGGASYTANFVSLITGSAPVILTPPVITNSLLVVSNQFVVVVGETNVFTVGAADPVDNNLLRYQWIFGDGQTSVWSTAAEATHVYGINNCGPYTASVTVSNTQAAINSNLSVSAACLLPITKLQLGVSFSKANADSGSLTATLPLPGITNLTQLTGRTVLVDIGTAQVLFTLDNKGRGLQAVGTCRLAYTKPTKTKPGYWTVTFALSKGTWQATWAVFGLDNATHKSPGVSVTLPVVVVVGDEAFAAEASLHYTATLNKTGTAK